MRPISNDQPPPARGRLSQGGLRLAQAAVVALASAVATRAEALQPLSAFVASAQQSNPDNREAQATERQRRAQVDVARAAYLPTFTAQGVYTRNQFEAALALPTGQRAVIQPYNGLDAYFTLSVPLINVGAWRQRGVAAANASVAAASRQSMQQTVEVGVTQAYYQLLGSEAVLAAASKGLEVAQRNVKLVRDRKELGVAGELDLQRALADEARAQQDVASAEQGVVLARRSLESQSRLTPEPATRADQVDDDLRDEAPLSTWLRPGGELVPVRQAALATEAARRSLSAARAGWLPVLSAQAQEHLTNAGGFANQKQVYTLSASATWRFDFSLAPGVAAQSAGVEAAQAREDKARRSAEDAIYQAWHQVRVGVEKARAARAQVGAATLAQDLARERYASGAATQLDVVQAQRDLFAAAVSQAQASFDLQYARALLRIASRRTDRQEDAR